MFLSEWNFPLFEFISKWCSLIALFPSFIWLWSTFDETLIWHLLHFLLWFINRSSLERPNRYTENMKIFGSLICSCVAFLSRVIVEKSEKKIINSQWFHSRLDLWHRVIDEMRRKLLFDVDWIWVYLFNESLN